MTTEEKAKAYDEALEKARANYKADKEMGFLGNCDMLELIFPEIKESEDERIRKELLEVVRHCYEDGGYTLCTNDYKKYLAYLERQKEKSMSATEVLVKAGLKPYKDGNQWCVLAGDNIQEGICGFGDTIDDALYQFLMEVFEKQKEQKSVQTEDEKEYVRIIKSLIADFIRDKKPEDVAYYQRIYNWLDGRHIEQKPVEINVYEIIKKHITEDSLSSEVNKRLKECGWYVTDEKPAEWSEEDEIRKESCMLYLANTRDGIEFSQHIGDNARESGKKEIQKDIDWLKSLPSFLEARRIAT